MPRSALLPPRPTVAGNAPEDLFEINVQQIATSLREAWSALQRTNLERAEAERLPVPVTFAEGDQVLVLYNASAKRRNKHYMASEGPCTVTKINGNDYEVRNNATNNVKSVHWSVLHRVFDRKLSQSSGAGRGTKDAEERTTGDAPGAQAPGARDLTTGDAPGAQAPGAWDLTAGDAPVADAPGVQGQQPDVSKTGKDKNARRVRGPRRPRTRRVTRASREALGPDVVNE